VKRFILPITAPLLAELVVANPALKMRPKQLFY